METWRPIPGFDYEASSEGRIRHSPTGRIKEPGSISDGYPQIYLSKPGAGKSDKVSVFVCVAFYGPRPSKRHQAAHWDGNKLNNAASNLRWATFEENEADKVRHGRVGFGRNGGGGPRSEPSPQRGEGQPGHLLTDAMVVEMRADRRSGMTFRRIAERHSQKLLTTYFAIRGKAWAHLPGAVQKSDGCTKFQGRPTKTEVHASQVESIAGARPD